jgi:hypothetical protein
VWGSDDPTKAAFPFLHSRVLAEGDRTAQIFLLGEAVSLMHMRLSLAKAEVRLPRGALQRTRSQCCY